MLIRVAVCALVAGARLVELRISARNMRERGGREGRLSRRTYPAMVALHATTIVATLVAGNRARPGWVALVVALQPARWLLVRRLGASWNTRAMVSERTVVETGGPYRYIRHPNYVVVLVELFALPLAFGLRSLALVATAVNAAILAIRIRDEERLLMALPAYREHFADKARFIPFVF